MSQEGLIIKIECPDQPGIVAKLSSYVATHGGNLLGIEQFSDSKNRLFFARLHIDNTGLDIEESDFKSGFSILAKGLKAKWSMKRLPYKMRTAILVTKTTHCLNEILWRAQLGELPVEITSIIGNRESCREIAENAGIPFHYIEMGGDDKLIGFEKIRDVLLEERVELAVLARFMQILPDWFCEKFSGKIINIHHSFLPAFIGANPYRKAYERGVKLIGATCHYVTSHLDAGPIIEQEVQRVQHFHTPADLVRLGRDCERNALARGIRHHVHLRTIIIGNRAIVFSD